MLNKLHRDKLQDISQSADTKQALQSIIRPESALAFRNPANATQSTPCCSSKTLGRSSGLDPKGNANVGICKLSAYCHPPHPGLSLTTACVTRNTSISLFRAIKNPQEACERCCPPQARLLWSPAGRQREWLSNSTPHQRRTLPNVFFLKVAETRNLQDVAEKEHSSVAEKEHSSVLRLGLSASCQERDESAVKVQKRPRVATTPSGAVSCADLLVYCTSGPTAEQILGCTSHAGPLVLSQNQERK